MEKEIARYHGCFVCGNENVIGLNLTFQTDGEITRTRWLPDKRHEGYKDIVHGGLLAAVLDEVMIKAALALGIRCVTASMEVRYKAPAVIGDELLFEGKIAERKGRIIFTTGLARNGKGVVVVEGTGKYLTLPEELDKRLAASLE